MATWPRLHRVPHEAELGGYRSRPTFRKMRLVERNTVPTHPLLAEPILFHLCHFAYAQLRTLGQTSEYTHGHSAPRTRWTEP